MTCPRERVVQPQDDSIRYIALTRGKIAIVDASDYEQLTQRKWSAWVGPRGDWYAIRGGGKYPHERMHRVIVNATPGQLVDHWNHDTLDNRRENLRVCTTTQNNANQRLSCKNTSGFKGVTWDKQTSTWRASIGNLTPDGKRYIHLGRFSDPLEAARAYDAMAVELYGEFALTNGFKTAFVKA